MKQAVHKKPHVPQVKYQDRWVDRTNFRVFVYGKDDQQKLVNSFDEYKRALATGEWFSTKEEVPSQIVEAPKKVRKPKDGADS